jgi:hypothetical protein
MTTGRDMLLWNMTEAHREALQRAVDEHMNDIDGWVKEEMGRINVRDAVRIEVENQVWIRIRERIRMATDGISMDTATAAALLEIADAIREGTL